MSDDFKVRCASSKDAAILLEFNLRMARETEEKELSPQTLAAGVKAVLEDSARGFYLVVEMKGEVVGSLMVTTEWSDWRNGDFWWIQSVYVQPESRNRGVFSLLMKEVRERAQNADDVCGCRLYVDKDNTTAQEVYSRRGFQETSYKLFEDLF